MRQRTFLIAVLVTCSTFASGFVPLARAQSPDPLEDARTQYERHNYQAVVAPVERYLEMFPDGPFAADAAKLRALAKIGLREWDAGVEAAREAIDGYPQLNDDIALHEALAKVGERIHNHSRLALVENQLLTELHIKYGDKDKAALAQLAMARAFARTSDIEVLQEYGLDVEGGNWKDISRFRRGKAVACCDRAIELAESDDVIEQAMTAKALLFSRDIRVDRLDADTAISLYAEIVVRWPASSRAAKAHLAMGELYANSKKDYVSAMLQFREVLDIGDASKKIRKQAQRQISRIEEPTIHLHYADTYLPNEPVHIGWSGRNVDEIQFEAIRVDPVKMADRGLTAWDVAKRKKPDFSWKMVLSSKRDYQSRSSEDYDEDPSILPTTEPGAYVVTAKAEGQWGGEARDTSLLLVSDLGVITHSDDSQALFWVVDAITGRPIGGAEVHVFEEVKQNKVRIDQFTTDDAGIARFVSEVRGKRGSYRSYHIVVKNGEHYALVDTHYYTRRPSRDYRLHSYTDRPVYRLGQKVNFKHTLRRIQDGEYVNQPNRMIVVRVRDPRNELMYEGKHSTGAYGTVSGEWTIPAEPALGVYSFECELDGQRLPMWEDFGTHFRVEEYRKPEFQVEVKPRSSSSRIGDEITIDIVAKYYFGDAVADAEVEYELYSQASFPRFRPTMPCPWLIGHDDRRMAAFTATGAASLYRMWFPEYGWGRDLVMRGKARTNAQGVASITFKAEEEDYHSAYLQYPVEADTLYHVDARVVDSSQRLIEGAGSVIAAKRAFNVWLSPQRNVYEPGDTVHMDINSNDANDKAVAFEGVARMHRLIREPRADDDASGCSEYVYKLGAMVAEEKISVGEHGGVFRPVADEAGPFRIVVTAEVDGEPEDLLPRGECDVWVAKDGASYADFKFREIELVFDKPFYSIGDVAKVLINVPHDAAYVFLTVEGERLIDHKLVYVPKRSKLIEIPIGKRHAPNFHLSAETVARGDAFRDMRQIIVPPVEQLLSVEIATEEGEFTAGDSTSATVSVTDHKQAPAEAEVAVMVVDSSTYYIQPEFREAIDQYFYGGLRYSGVSYDYCRKQDHRPCFRRRVGGESALSNSGEGVFFTADAAKGVSKSMLDEEVAGGGDGADDYGAVPPAVRSDFADAIVWIAHGLTDEAGKLNVEIPFSDDLTTWAMHAIAIDKDTRVGEASTELVTTKDIIARLQTPRFMVEGDTAYFTVIAHNDLEEAIDARVSLVSDGAISIESVLINGEEQTADEEGGVVARVKAHGEAVVHFKVRAVDVEDCVLTASVASKQGGDAVERTIPILRYGAKKLVTRSGSVGADEPQGSEEVTFSLPEEIDATSPELEIHLNPSIASVMLDAIPYLLEYPYGCTEQTMSRFIPAVVTRRTLIELGVSFEDIRRMMEVRGDSLSPGDERWRSKNPVFDDYAMQRIINDGLDRIADMQQADGGWGWWKLGPSDAYMTAYVVYGLSEAVAADVAFDRTILDRGIAYLANRVVDEDSVSRGWRRDDDNIRTWMLYSISCVDRKILRQQAIKEQLERIYDARDGLSDYGRAMLAITLHRAREIDKASIVVENFDNSVRLDKLTDTASWGWATGYWRWYDNGIEATSMSLRAMLLVSPEHPNIPRAMNWLVRSRHGMRWQSTKDTAFAVYALADFLKSTDELSSDMTMTVHQGERFVHKFRVTPENVLLGDRKVVIKAEHLQPGSQVITISKEGKGQVYYSAYLDYYTKEKPITREGYDLHVRRSYHLVRAEEAEETDMVWNSKERKRVPRTRRVLKDIMTPIGDGDQLAIGDIIEVELSIDARNNLSYLMFRDPKPSGCEPVDLRSGRSYGMAGFAHMELRDDEVTFFSTHQDQGKTTLRYRLRCETAGRFSVLPTQAEAMYAPFIRSNSDSNVLGVKFCEGE